MKILLTLTLFVTFGFADFIHKGETVIDTQTHLQWQDIPNNGEKDEIHKLANSYCIQSRVGGFDDWRLPTKKELQELAKKMQNKQIFHYSDEVSYWTSDEDKEDELNAWAIYFPNAHAFTEDKCEKEHFRCVRTVK